MTAELDLDDAVANVSGDRARRELEELRAERDELLAHCERLREALKESLGQLDYLTEANGLQMGDPRSEELARSALNETHEQSLAEVRADAVKGAATALMPAPPSPPDDPDPGFNGYCEAIAEVHDYSKKIRRGEV